jgi:hypoxanthine phosphoribosyltransferase
MSADYVGFEVPDAWMIGYGMDAHGQGRGLPYVAMLETADPAKIEVVGGIG